MISDRQNDIKCAKESKITQQYNFKRNEDTMKAFIVLAILATSAFADIIEVDWSNVRPIKEYPEFWKNKPISLRPPSNYFTATRNRRIVNGEETQ